MRTIALLGCAWAILAACAHAQGGGRWIRSRRRASGP